MKHLIYKELTLSINGFFYVLPLLLSTLFFIPNWFFTIILMYFIWISVTNIFSAYNAQQDYHFINLLPVTKEDVVKSKIIVFMFLELVHILLAVVFGIVHNLLYGSVNFGLDINLAFYGTIFFTYAVFNIIFLPLYFKTAYKFGLPTIYGVIASTLLIVFFEIGTMMIPAVRNILEHNDIIIQGLLLLVGIASYAISNIIATKYSIKNYRRINQ